MPLPFEIDLDALRALPKVQREVVSSELALVKGLVDKNPLWDYVPHVKQGAYHGISVPVGAFVGGNRSGKSTGGTADDLIQLCDRECLPPWLEPFKRWDEFYCRVVTPDLVATLEGVVLPLFRKLVPKGQLWKGNWEKAFDARRRRLQFANGNWVDFMSHEMDIDRFSGASLMRVRFDEEPPGNKGRQIFRESTMRTIDHDGEVRFTMTPLLGLSWTYHELTVLGEPRWDDSVQVVTVDMDDNPHLNEKAKKRVLAGLSEAERQARKAGRWVHFEGLIYPQFDWHDRHVVPQGPVPRDERGRVLVACYGAIDPGIAHPTGVIWGWVDDEDVLTIFDCLKVSGLSVEEVCSRIQTVEAQHGIRCRRPYAIDPSARNKQHATGRSLQFEYSEHGVITRPGQNDRRAGFNRVRERLETDRLVIMANCEDLVQELREYRWKPPKGTEDAGREEPVKVNDDLADALRYLEMALPRKPRPGEDEGEPFDPRKHLVRDHLARLRRPRQHSLLGAIFQ